MDRNAKLIILRGNSGSGKTSTAKALQKRLGHETMLISQDMVRREMIYVKDGPDNIAIQLLYELACYGKKHCNIVILEGILYSLWYKPLFDQLKKEFQDNIYAYYFDLPFEETINRHQHKPNVHDFGEKEMRSWWNEKDLLDKIPEVSIHKELNIDDVVDMIYNAVIR